MSDKSEFGGIRGADQIALLVALKMVKSETNLGGDILNGAAPGTWCRHVWDNVIDELGDVSHPNRQRMSLVWRIKTGFFQHWQGAPRYGRMFLPPRNCSPGPRRCCAA